LIKGLHFYPFNRSTSMNQPRIGHRSFSSIAMEDVERDIGKVTVSQSSPRSFDWLKAIKAFGNHESMESLSRLLSWESLEGGDPHSCPPHPHSCPPQPHLLPATAVPVPRRLEQAALDMNAEYYKLETCVAAAPMVTTSSPLHTFFEGASILSESDLSDIFSSCDSPEHPHTPSGSAPLLFAPPNPSPAIRPLAQAHPLANDAEITMAESLAFLDLISSTSTSSSSLMSAASFSDQSISQESDLFNFLFSESDLLKTPRVSSESTDTTIPRRRSSASQRGLQPISVFTPRRNSRFKATPVVEIEDPLETHAEHDDVTQISTQTPMAMVAPSQGESVPSKSIIRQRITPVKDLEYNLREHTRTAIFTANFEDEEEEEEEEEEEKEEEDDDEYSNGSSSGDDSVAKSGGEGKRRHGAAAAAAAADDGDDDEDDDWELHRVKEATRRIRSVRRPSQAVEGQVQAQTTVSRRPRQESAEKKSATRVSIHVA
jgi:hypothetical protein